MYYAIRLLDVTWPNDDQDLSHPMEPLGHIELM